MSAVAASYSKKQVSSPGMAIAFTNQHALEQFAERSVRQLNFGCGRSGGEDAILPRERGSQPCLKECRLPDSRVALKDHGGGLTLRNSVETLLKEGKLLFTPDDLGHDHAGPLLAATRSYLHGHGPENGPGGPVARKHSPCRCSRGPRV